MNDLSGAWKSDPYWLSWGTKYDGTDLVYYLPEVYDNSINLMVKEFKGQIKYHIRHGILQKRGAFISREVG